MSKQLPAPPEIALEAAAWFAEQRLQEAIDQGIIASTDPRITALQNWISANKSKGYQNYYSSVVQNIKEYSYSEIMAICSSLPTSCFGRKKIMEAYNNLKAGK